ncbi:uncharacterized protein BDV17DRAFT_166021 [Aspergillus undulatus]|uniref:uncharacterized protein n=1 Tax=Aspergillus undulatus TaxID=1810928 RepID=UPI003CCCEB72
MRICLSFRLCHSYPLMMTRTGIPFCCQLRPTLVLTLKSSNARIVSPFAHEKCLIRSTGNLRPYICTYSRCKAPDQPYDSIGDWINHEVLNHGVQASNKEGLQVTPSESQTQRACPFCLMSAVSPFHIASHLRRIASFALPRYTGDDNTGDESGLSDEAELRSRQSKLPGATFSNDSGKGPGNDQLASEPKYIASSSLKDIEQLIPRNETNLMNVHNFLGTLDKGSQPLSGKDESSTVDNNHKSFYDSDMELDYDAYAGGDYGYNSMPSSSGSQADGTPHSQNIAPPAHQQDQELPYARLEPDGRLADRPSSPVEFERKDTETNEPLQEDTLSQSNNNADTDQRDVPAPHETYNPTEDALALRDALSRSRNIDTKTLIQILPHLTNHEMLDLRKEYKKHVKISGKGVNLAKHIRVKLGNSAIGKVCYATALGRWESEAFWANCYYQLGSSRRELLIESLFGRSNGEMREIKNSFKDSQYADSLEKCMMAELKADKFRTAVLLALEEGRQSECDTVDTELVHRDVQALHAALISRNGGETGMMYIIVRRSDSHLREVLRAYEKNYNRNFAREMIQKSQNLVGETLAHILNGAINRPMRDALLLHQALHESRSGGGRSELLISRLVRLHWEPRHCENVKAEFRRRYGQRLEEAIVEEILPSSGGSEWGEFCIQLALSSRSHAAKG